MLFYRAALPLSRRPTPMCPGSSAAALPRSRVREAAGGPSHELGGAVVRFGLGVGDSGENGVEDRLLPFFDCFREGIQLGDVDVVGAPQVEKGEPVADDAGRRGAAGFRGAEREEVPELLFQGL